MLAALIAAVIGAVLVTLEPETGGAEQSAPAPPAAEASVGVSTTIGVLAPAAVVATSESGDHHASHLIDGDPDSVWLSAPGDSAASLTFEFTRPVILKEIEFVFIPGDEHGGDVARMSRFELDVGGDAAPITLELDGATEPHRVQFASRVASNVIIRVVDVTGESQAEDDTMIGFAEIRLLGVS